MDKYDRKVLDKAYELGFNYEKEYMGCCQCTLAALQDTLGIKNDAVFKAGTGFAAGIGVTGAGICGALVGGIMFISSKIGRERKNFKDPERIRWKTYELVKQLYHKFIEEYDSTNCADIQKKLMGRHFSLWSPDDFEQFDRAGGHSQKCPSVVGDVSRWTIEVLLAQ